MNSLEPPKNTQSYAVKQITNKFFPRFTSEGSTYAYFHSLSDRSATDIECLEYVQTNLTKELQSYEKEKNKTIIHTLPQGYYTTNEIVKGNFLSKNKKGTLISLEMESLGKALYDDFTDIKDIVTESVNSHCTEDERKEFKWGMMGLAEFLIDVRKSMKK